jgi:catecholate siderophore receptor
MHRFAVPALGALVALVSFAAPSLAQGVQDSTATRTGRDSAQSLSTVRVTGRAVPRSKYSARRTLTATKTDTPLRDTPQSVTVVTRALIADQGMQSMADVVRYVPGITMGQGEGHRDAPTIRGNSSTADFFVDGVRDDAQYYRDLYNAERVEALKGSNAMIFGRGGGGGIVNRVSKEAGWLPTRALTLEGGSFEHRRGTIDVGQGFSEQLAARLNGMYERSGTFRDFGDLRRYGVNPTLTYAPDATTHIHAGYEYFDDHRVVDRGIPSFHGAPASAPLATFFGDPYMSYANARVHTAGIAIEHEPDSGLVIRNRTRFVHYDKFYQNVYPGAMSANGAQVSIAGYNNATQRGNVFNQTDLTYKLATGAIAHTLLGGMELGRQVTDNFRETGYFGNATSMSVPFAQPTVASSVVFRQSATDADNHVVADVASLYAQDQIALSRQWQAIVGARVERFGIALHDNRTGANLRRDDHMFSPRVGLVYKPAEPVSIYGSRSISYLPSAGDQFSSLNATTQTLAPERFVNSELGAKWDVTSDVALTTALYRLDRTNTSAKDPSDPSKTVQTGSQRTTGFELGATGNLTSAWSVAGAYAAQRAVIVSTTTAAKSGVTVPLVPRTTLSLWNRYDLTPTLGLGLGVIHQARMYAAIDNTVTLPSFTRADGALFVKLTGATHLQVNVENVFDRRYYPTSQGNNNIMPGAPRTVRVAVVGR